MSCFCFFPYGAIGATAVYAAFCAAVLLLPLFGQAAESSCTIGINDCRSEGVDNAPIAWASNFFIVTAFFLMASHILCSSGGGSGCCCCGSLRGAVLAFLAASVAHIFWGIIGYSFGNDGTMDGIGNRAYFFLNMLAYLFAADSLFEVTGLAVTVWTTIVPEYRSVCCGRAALRFFEVLVSITILVIVWGCLWCWTTPDIWVKTTVDEIPNDLDEDDANVHICIQMVDVGQVVFTAVQALFWISVASIYGASARQQMIELDKYYLVWGLPTSLAAAGVICFQTTLFVMHLMAYLLQHSSDGSDAPAQPDNTVATVASIAYHYSLFMTGYLVHNLLLSSMSIPIDAQHLHPIQKQNTSLDSERHQEAEDENIENTMKNTSRGQYDQEINPGEGSVTAATAIATAATAITIAAETKGAKAPATKTKGISSDKDDIENDKYNGDVSNDVLRKNVIVPSSPSETVSSLEEEHQPSVLLVNYPVSALPNIIPTQHTNEESSISLQQQPQPQPQPQQSMRLQVNMPCQSLMDDEPSSSGSDDESMVRLLTKGTSCQSAADLDVAIIAAAFQSKERQPLAVAAAFVPPPPPPPPQDVFIPNKSSPPSPPSDQQEQQQQLDLIQFCGAGWPILTQLFGGESTSTATHLGPRTPLSKSICDDFIQAMERGLLVIPKTKNRTVATTTSFTTTNTDSTASMSEETDTKSPTSNNSQSALSWLSSMLYERNKASETTSPANSGVDDRRKESPPLQRHPALDPGAATRTHRGENEYDIGDGLPVSSFPQRVNDSNRQGRRGSITKYSLDEDESSQYWKLLPSLSSLDSSNDQIRAQETEPKIGRMLLGNGTDPAKQYDEKSGNGDPEAADTLKKVKTDLGPRSNNETQDTFLRADKPAKRSKSYPRQNHDVAHDQNFVDSALPSLAPDTERRQQRQQRQAVTSNKNSGRPPRCPRQ